MSYKGLCTSKYLIITGFQQKKLHSLIKGKKKQSEETKQVSEADSDIAEIMKLSDSEFKINMIDMLRALMEKVYNFQEQMDNENREIETHRKKIQEIVE